MEHKMSLEKYLGWYFSYTGSNGNLNWFYSLSWYGSKQHGHSDR